MAEKTTPRTWDDVQTVSHTKKAVPEGLWMKCPSCAETVFRKAVESNLRVCPKCDHHLRVGGPERVEQLLANLIENAVKYGGSGGEVKITLATSPRDPALRAPAVRIQVIDKGPGIASNRTERA